MKIVSKDIWEMFLELYKSFKKQVSIQEELIKTQEELIKTQEASIKAQEECIKILFDYNQTYRDILNGRYVKEARAEE